MTSELQTLIEATLFGVGKSMSVEQLSHGLKQEIPLVSEALLGLQSSLKRRRGGGSKCRGVQWWWWW